VAKGTNTFIIFSNGGNVGEKENLFDSWLDSNISSRMSNTDDG